MHGKIWACIAAIFLLALRCAAQTPAAVPITSEQHHHLALQNEYVRLFEVEVPPHQSTLLHQHDYDYIYIAIGDAQFTNILPGKAPAAIRMADGDIHFSRGGFAHLARNDANTPFRNVTIELLRPQGAVRNLCKQIVAGAPDAKADCPDAASNQYFARWPQFETDEIRASLVRLDPHIKVDFRFLKDHPESSVPREWLILAVNPIVIKTNLKGARHKNLKPGEFLWTTQPDFASVENPRNEPVQYYLLEFSLKK